MKDISEFLAHTRIADRLNVPLKKRVGYDDPCHLIHGQRIKAEPRALLRAIPGIDLVEVPGADQCCGSAGIYNITQTEISMSILDAKDGTDPARGNRSAGHRQSGLHVSIPIWRETRRDESRSRASGGTAGSALWTDIYWQL